MRANNDLESEIHRVEQDAYTGVLRAFKVQSDAISWVYNQIETCSVSFSSHTWPTVCAENKIDVLLYRKKRV
jgi:hypothetical protein